MVIMVQPQYPAGIYLLKVDNKNTRTRCEICSKLTIKTPEQLHWSRSDSSVSIINFEHVIAGWLKVFTLVLNFFLWRRQNENKKFHLSNKAKIYEKPGYYTVIIFLFMEWIVGYTKPVFSCSKSTMGTSEQYLKSV